MTIKDTINQISHIVRVLLAEAALLQWYVILKVRFWTIYILPYYKGILFNVLNVLHVSGTKLVICRYKYMNTQIK